MQLRVTPSSGTHQKPTLLAPLALKMFTIRCQAAMKGPPQELTFPFPDHGTAE